LVQQLEQTRRESEQTRRAHDEQIQQLRERVKVLSERSSEQPANDGAMPPRDDVRTTDIVAPVPDYTEDQFPTDTPAPSYPYSNCLDNKRLPLKASFGPGFRLESLDEEFRFNVRLESQVEGRV